MNSYLRERGMKRYGIILGALAVLVLVGTAIALDPVPDYKTLVMPTLVPKSGHGPNPPANFESGLIRNAYDTTYETYWKETSYFQYNNGTGEKIRGYYNDTKTYGYAQMPWQLHSAFSTPLLISSNSLLGNTLSRSFPAAASASGSSPNQVWVVLQHFNPCPE